MKTTIINNLEWQVAETGRMTWDDAVKYAASLGDGWRLPTVTELVSLIDYENFDPAIDTTIFPDCCYKYWSGSPYAYYSNYACYVSFVYGAVNYYYKTNLYYVRCVREVPK